jgi:hypothetical protein
MRRSCPFGGLGVGGPSNDGSPDSEKAPACPPQGPRAARSRHVAEEACLSLDYSAARQRKVCSSGQASDMVKEMK